MGETRIVHVPHRGTLERCNNKLWVTIMTIFNSPRGLSVLSFVLIAGCNDDDRDKPVEEPRDAQLSVSVHSRHGITNVRKLVLNITPIYLYQSDGSGMRLLSDESGQNMISEGNNPQRNITIIDTLESNPLRAVNIAVHATIPPASQGQQSHLWFQAWSMDGVRDSYVELDDGRYCDVNLILTGDHDPRTTGDQYLSYPLSGLTIGSGERWRIDLQIDPSMTSFNPANCASTTDLYLWPDVVSFGRM